MADSTENEALKSPDALDVRKGVKRKLGKPGGRIIVSAGIGLAAVVGIAAINIATQKPAMEVQAEKKAAETNDASLEPATMSATSMNAKAPDAVLAPPAAPAVMPVAMSQPASTPALPVATGDDVPPLTDMNNGGVPAQGPAGRPAGDPDAHDAYTAGSRVRDWEGTGGGGGNPVGGDSGFMAAVAGANAGGSDPMAAIQKQVADAEQAAAAAAAKAGGQAGGGSSQNTDPNGQNEKLAFLKAANELTSPTLNASVHAARSEYEIKTGTVVPAVLISGVNSDVPGCMLAQVSQTVYDSATGRFPLIPQGAKFYGCYDSKVAYGQTRAVVVWQRIIYPDSSTLEIGGMPGTDQAGYAGFHDKVNNHYGRLLGFGVATSLFSAAFQLSQPQQTTSGQQLNSQQVVAGSVGQELSQLGQQVTSRNLDIQPTLEIRPGYRFLIMVNKDMVFPSAYGQTADSTE
jgi:type IV secretion system protein VirB10